MRPLLVVICLLGLLSFVSGIESYLRNYSGWHALSVDLREFTPTDTTEAKIFQDAIARAEPEALWPMVEAILSITIAIFAASALWLSRNKKDQP
jgi:disulfide bond formation protein DsbB